MFRSKLKTKIKFKKENEKVVLTGLTHVSPGGHSRLVVVLHRFLNKHLCRHSSKSTMAIIIVFKIINIIIISMVIIVVLHTKSWTNTCVFTLNHPPLALTYISTIQDCFRNILEMFLRKSLIFNFRQKYWSYFSGRGVLPLAACVWPSCCPSGTFHSSSTNTWCKTLISHFHNSNNSNLL